MAGRASVELKGRELGYDLSADPEALSRVVKRVKDLEARGFTFEAADASFELLVRDERGTTGDRQFTLESWRVIVERDADGLARVELRDPEGGGLTLWADESYRYLQLFTGDPLPDVSRRSLAVEPMTCPPNAFRAGEDLIRLEPGATVVSAWGITPA